MANKQRIFLGSLLSVALAILIACPSIYALGIEAFPALLSVQSIKPGEPFNLFQNAGIYIFIPNNTKTTSYYIIEVIDTATDSDGLGDLKGYSILPDESWVEYPKDTLTVPPGDTAKVNFTLTIPAQPEFYNQAYQVTFGICKVMKTAIQKDSPGAGFRVGINLKYFFETLLDREPSVPPDGIMGVAPITLREYKYTPGETRETYITIFNNDDVEHNYALESYIGPHYGPTDTINFALDFSPTANMSWISDLSWIQPKNLKTMLFFDKGQSITIPANESRKYPVIIDIPKDAQTLTKWVEAILFVTSDSGVSRFSRVKVENDNFSN
ncbi:hypothetical protein JXI42_00485 [bacterium]|nr:hypothetical protein [bacterium]